MLYNGLDRSHYNHRRLCLHYPCTYGRDTRQVPRWKDLRNKWRKLQVCVYMYMYISIYLHIYIKLHGTENFTIRKNRLWNEFLKKRLVYVLKKNKPLHSESLWLFDKLRPALRVGWLIFEFLFIFCVCPWFFFFFNSMASYLAAWWVIFEVCI